VLKRGAFFEVDILMSPYIPVMPPRFTERGRGRTRLYEVRGEAKEGGTKDDKLLSNDLKFVIQKYKKGG
jgi:hypothetical protein